MKKDSIKKLQLSTTTVRLLTEQLTEAQLKAVAGGLTATCTSATQFGSSPRSVC